MTLAMSSLIVGCGGGGSGGDDSITKVIMDDPITGLNYQCSSDTTIKTTNSRGEFTCKKSDDVTFLLGTYILGTVNIGKGTSTYIRIAHLELTQKAITDIRQLLQTIDETNNDNLIKIKAGYKALNDMEKHPGEAGFEEEAEDKLGKILVSEEEANKNADLSYEKSQYLDAINNARAHNQDCGTKGLFSATTALAWNDYLYNASYEHSKDMAVNNIFDHDGSDTETDLTAKAKELGRGSHGYERIDYNGYTSASRSGENIAAGYSSTEDVIKGWIKSDGHCANLMNPNYEDVGMALYKKDGTDYKYYWTQNFGAK